MKNAVLLKLSVLVLVCVSTAETFAQSISGVINTYYRVTAINTTTNGLTVSNSAGLAPGIKVLIIQMKGASIDNTNTSAFGNITGIAEAGSYEYNVVCGVSGNDILFRYEFNHAYSDGGSVQLIPVPQYNIVTVTDTVKPSGWSAGSGTGGVVVIEADTLYLNSAISASGLGFAGGNFMNFTTPTYDCSWAVNVTSYFLSLAPSPNQYYSGGHKGEGIADFLSNGEYGRGKQANGGGGGNNHNTGGAGGANYGAGGNGGYRSNEGFFLCHGTNPGIGGIPLSSYGYSIGTNKIFMGGGGGSGHQNNAKGTPGGNGGGIVIVKANVLIGSGTSIMADGISPVNITNVDPLVADGDGGGGGGAGGSVVFDVGSVIGSVDVTARGARGSDGSRATSDCLGPGGGGGGGVVWTSGGAITAGVNTVVTAGGNGVISASSSGGCAGQANGATPGDAGTAIFGYIPPAYGNLICTPLSIPELQFFRGRLATDMVELSWNLSSIANIATYEIERSTSQASFSKVKQIANNGTFSFTANDELPVSGTVFYRLKIIRKDGSIGYSQVITLTRSLDEVVQQLNVFPNPTSSVLKVGLLLRETVAVRLSIVNVSGQILHHTTVRTSAGSNVISIPVASLANGVYWVIVDTDGFNHRRKFIKWR